MIKFIRKYISENKYYFIISGCFFIFCILIYRFLPFNISEKIQIVSEVKKYIGNLSIYMKSPLLTLLIIFFNNIFIFFIIFISGFLFSIFGSLVVFSQIIITLLVVELAIINVGLYKTLLLILPHGIFEIISMIFSLALSLKLTTITVSKIIKWDTPFLKEIKKAFKFFILVILPITLLAAFIEVFITSLFK